MLKVGVTYPQTEFGSDPSAIRDFAQTAESLGYAFILAYDHVLGADPNRGGPWPGPYTYQHAFHEPLVLFGYWAGLTRTIQLVTGVIILPQRQAPLVAKQAAEVDVLSNGRLRLGVGIGWNQVEHEALGFDFHNRGKRTEEQIAVMRALWTQELVTFHGKWHQLDRVGLKPLPVQRPIPVWMGGGNRAEPGGDRALRRIARLADGWIMTLGNMDQQRARIAQLRKYLQAAGRAHTPFGIMASVSLREGTPTDWPQRVAAWKEMGVAEVTVNTMGAGLSSSAEHIRAIQEAAEWAKAAN